MVSGSAWIGMRMRCDKRKAAQIVDAVHVVGVGMGVEHCVDAANTIGDHLLAKIRPGVDRDGGLAAIGADLPDQKGGAGAAVPGIVRITGAPVAIDARHAGRPRRSPGQ